MGHESQNRWRGVKFTSMLAIAEYMSTRNLLVGKRPRDSVWCAFHWGFKIRREIFWAIILPWAMGQNGVTHRYGHGGNGHNRKVAGNKGINPGAGRPGLERQAPLEAVGEDSGFPDLGIQDVQMDGPVSQRTPPHHRCVEAWKR